MTELEKAFNGQAFNPLDKEVLAYQARAKKMCHEMNLLAPDDAERNKILAELVTGYSPAVFVESGF